MISWLKEKNTASDVSMAAIARLLKDHRNALSTKFKAIISNLEAKIDLVLTAASSHVHHIVYLQTNADTVSKCIVALGTTWAELRIWRLEVATTPPDCWDSWSDWRPTTDCHLLQTTPPGAGWTNSVDPPGAGLCILIADSGTQTEGETDTSLDQHKALRSVTEQKIYYFSS